MQISIEQNCILLMDSHQNPEENVDNNLLIQTIK